MLGTGERRVHNPDVRGFVGVYLIPALRHGKGDAAANGVLAAGFRLCQLAPCHLGPKGTSIITLIHDELTRQTREPGAACTLRDVANSWDRFSERSHTLSLRDRQVVRGWLIARFTALGGDRASLPGSAAGLRIPAVDASASKSYAYWRHAWLDSFIESEEAAAVAGGVGAAPVASRRVPTPRAGTDPTVASPISVSAHGFSDGELEALVARVDASIAYTSSSACLATLKQVVRSNLHRNAAFDEYRASPQNQVFVVPDSSIMGRDVWFVGDIHGDILGLETILLHIERTTTSGPPIVMFLGDLVDDGPHGLEVFARVIRRIHDAPRDTCLLTGNHDAAVLFDGATFASEVSPSDFSEWLNADPNDTLRREMGALFVECFRDTPRALLFSHGLVVAHGGIPLVDLHGGIETAMDLDRPECRQDFIWTRAHPRAKKKRPNRTSRGSQFGWEDLDQFLAVAGRAVGFPLHRMIRGHDHIDERFASYEDYPAPRLVTVNSMSHRLGREFGGPYARTPCIARHRFGEPIEIHRLMLPLATVERVYPEN